LSLGGAPIDGSAVGLMLIRLTKAMRWRAASAVALLYMLCVLAPAAAFAFGDGSRAAHCLTHENHGLQRAHVHEHKGHGHNGHGHDGHEHAGGTAHVHDDGTIHDHSQAPDGKSSSGQCCGLVCLSALPAGVSDIETPALPAMTAVSANQEDLAGKPPDRLYRPPISPPSI
jgi:hypothetical protein